MRSPAASSVQLCRLLLIDLPNNEVLGVRGGADLSLPTIALPRGARPAAAINRYVRREFGATSVVIDWLPTSDTSTGYIAVVRLVNIIDDALARVLLRFKIGLETPSLPLPPEASAYLASLRKTDARAISVFQQLDWIEVVQGWMRSSFKTRTLTILDLEQLNAGPSFQLVRIVASDGGTYWLKAVGAPNTHEYAITQYLSSHFADFIPMVVASSPEWHAWLMVEAGRSLHHETSAGDFENAGRRLAELQRLSVSHVDDLCAQGCVDHRPNAIRGKLDELIEYLSIAASLQTSDKVPPLSQTRVREIGVDLHALLDAIEAMAFPNALLHGDISPGSILKLGTKVVFTDWCDSYVGMPLITMEQLRLFAKRGCPNLENQFAQLERFYLADWSDIVTEAQMKRAAALAPMASVLSHLYGRGSWFREQASLDPPVHAYVRSLARQMDRISMSPSWRNALLCHA